MNYDYINQYKILHKIKKNYGKTSLNLYDEIEKIINIITPTTILDYGCGKSKLVDYIKKNKNIKTYKYDPAIRKYSKLLKRDVDMIICTDVLQHVPLYDLDRVLNEITKKCKYCLFYIKCTNHSTILPNGNFANCTIHNKNWWKNKLNNYFKEIYEENINNDITSVFFVTKKGEKL